MRTNKKIISVILAIVLILSMSAVAFADWTEFGGSSIHNAVVSSAPTSTSPSITQLSLLGSGGGWDGVDTVPLMRTVDSTTYAYVLYDGHSNGCNLAKINCSASTPYIIWNKQIDTSSAFQLSTPLLVEGSSESADVIYAATKAGKVYSITGLNSTSASGVTVTALCTVTGQINTPITKGGNYIYFGTWIGNGTIDGSTDPGRYYQLNTTNTSDLQSVSSISKGFYWAGAVVYNNYVYFGGDDGYLYYRPVGSGFGTANDTDIYNTSFSLPSVSNNAAGNVRSTIMLNGTKIYFTTQSNGSSYGNVYCYSVSSSVPALSWGAVLPGTSTSSVVIANSGMIYAAIYGSSSKGIAKITAPTSGTVGSAFALTVGGSAFAQPVQCTPVVYSNSNYDFIYFNTNYNTGCGYCWRISNTATATNATQRWATTGTTYGLGGVAIQNGIAVFGNDYNYLYVVK